MSTVTVRLVRCAVRETVEDIPNVLCWGTLALEDGDAMPPILPCGHDSAGADVRQVEGQYSADGCDPACESATGSLCVCSCGGRNHGRDWLIAEAMGFRRGPYNSVMWDGSPGNPAAVERLREHFRKLNAEQNRARAIRRIVNRHIAAARAALTRREQKSGYEQLTRDSWIAATPENAAAAAYLESRCQEMETLRQTAQEVFTRNGESLEDPEYREAAARHEAVLDHFLLDLWRSLQRYGRLTERQVVAALRVRDRAAQAPREQGPVSQHVGTLGERIEVDVTVDRVRYLPSRYGRGGSTLVVMHDAAGNVLKTFAEGTAPPEAARAKLAKKLANADKRLEHAVTTGDEYAQRWARADVQMAQRVLARWDATNPGFA